MKLLRRSHLDLTPDQLDQTLEALEAFLRTELCAVEVYRLAFERVGDASLRGLLASLNHSHQGRAYLLRERLEEFGGRRNVPSASNGPWGAFAATIEHVQRATDEASLLRAICEGEAWAVKDYETDLGEIDAAIREPLEIIVLPEQRRTHRALEDIVRSRATLPTLVVRRRWWAVRLPLLRSDDRSRARI